MATFPEKVKMARNELGLTQTELGDAIGISLRTILDYEKGKKTPRQSTMLRLAKALKVSVKYLTDDECDDPMAEIEKDGFIEAARARYGAPGARDVDTLLSENQALFAGGELSQEQKDEFFQAIMAAYVTCREESKRKFTPKKWADRD